MSTQQPPAYSIQVARDLYLDSNNRFLSAPVAGLPMYQISGGLLSLPPKARDGLLTGELAILPVTGMSKSETSSWKTKLENLGVPSDAIALFDGIAGLAADVMTVVGWAQAAMKLLKWVGILGDDGKSIEEMLTNILAEVEALRDLVEDIQQWLVENQLQQLAAKVRNYENSSFGSSKGEPLIDPDFFITVTAAERRQRRVAILDMVEEEVSQLVRQMLLDSCWKLPFQRRHYHGSWAGRTTGTPIELRNPPWWGSPVALPGLKTRQEQERDDEKRGQHGDERRPIVWEWADYPSAKSRFDHRLALPALLRAAMSYLTILKLADPEFRSTGSERQNLRDFADDIGARLASMREVLARTHHEPHEVRVVGGVDAVTGRLTRPQLRWRVGAVDLCAHTDQYYTSQAKHADGHKLGVLDFDWTPDHYELEWIPTAEPLKGTGQWRFTDPQACADAANAQAERDYAVLLQSSGYVQLAQLEATLRHLATNPRHSETVSGTVRRRRRRLDTRPVEVTGEPGLICAVADVTAAGTLREYGYVSTVSIELQPPDRIDRLKYAYYLVALDRPATGELVTAYTDESWSDFAALVAVAELIPGDGRVELSAAHTFDLLVAADKPSASPTLPPHAHLEAVAQRTKFVALQTLPDAALVDITDPHLLLPEGDARNGRTEKIELDYTLALDEDDVRRTATVTLRSVPGTRNVANLYVAVAERINSDAGPGTRTLRTYFDVGMYTQLTYVPTSFFERERECLDRSVKVIDHIETNYSKSAQWLAPDVPVSVTHVREQVDAYTRAIAPDVLGEAIAAIGRQF